MVREETRVISSYSRRKRRFNDGRTPKASFAIALLHHHMTDLHEYPLKAAGIARNLTLKRPEPPALRRLPSIFGPIPPSGSHNPGLDRPSRPGVHRSSSHGNTRLPSTDKFVVCAMTRRYATPSRVKRAWHFQLKFSQPKRNCPPCVQSKLSARHSRPSSVHYLHTLTMFSLFPTLQ